MGVKVDMVNGMQLTALLSQRLAHVYSEKSEVKLRNIRVTFYRRGKEVWSPNLIYALRTLGEGVDTAMNTDEESWMDDMVRADDLDVSVERKGL